MFVILFCLLLQQTIDKFLFWIHVWVNSLNCSLYRTTIFILCSFFFILPVDFPIHILLSFFNLMCYVLFLLISPLSFIFSDLHHEKHSLPPLCLSPPTPSLDLLALSTSLTIFISILVALKLYNLVWRA